MTSFGGVLQWTFNVSSIIVMVFVLEAILGRKMKKTYQVVLWGLVLIRLLVPSMPSSSWSLFNMMPQYQQMAIKQNSQSGYLKFIEGLQGLVGHKEMAQLIDEESTGKGQSNLKLNGNNIAQNISEVKGDTQSSKAVQSDLMKATNSELQNDRAQMNLLGKVLQGKVLYSLWLIGVFCLSTYWLIGYSHAKRQIEKLEAVSDEAVLTLFEDCKQRVLGSKRGKHIKLVAGDYSMIFGISKPVITVPQDKGEKELKVILLHELMHYRFKDYLMTYIQLIALSVHWFNPLVWLAVKQMKKDMEYACDERVITLGISKKQYANTLLNMMPVIQDKVNDRGSFYMSMNAFAQGMGSEAQEAKHRIQKIARMKKGRLMSTVLSLALVSFLTVGCLTDAPALEETKTQAVTATPVTQKLNQIQNIAVFGLDHSGLRADTIFVANIDGGNGKLNVINIPRDTKIVLDDEEQAAIEKANSTKAPETCKFSELLAYSGKTLMQEVVFKEIEKLTDLKIDQYILIDTQAAAMMIDAMGGLEVNVPVRMSYDDNEQDLHIHLEPGLQHLDGAMVMEAVMFRKSSDCTTIYQNGDIDRVNMTQNVLKAIYENLKQITKPEDFIKLAKGVSSTVETNLPVTDFMNYYNLLDQVESTAFYIAPGENVMKDGRWYYNVDENECKKMITHIMGNK